MADTPQLGPFGHREEARKLWDYIVTDEVIYFPQIIDGDDDSIFLSTEARNWRDLNSWIELKLCFETERQSHNNTMEMVECIIEAWRHDERVAADNRSGLKKAHIVRKTSERNSMVLVDDIQLAQLPEDTVFVGVPSVIWLKRFDDRFRPVRHPVRIALEQFDRSVGSFHEDRKLGLGVGLPEANNAKLIGQIIKSAPQAVHEITNDDEHLVWWRRELNVKPVFPDFRVFFFGEYRWVEFIKPFDCYGGSFEMSLRPFDFQIGIGKASVFDSLDSIVIRSHGVNSRHGEDTKDAQRPRDSDSHQRGVHAESPESIQAQKVSEPTEEVTRGSDLSHLDAGCTAKHTRLDRSSNV